VEFQWSPVEFTGIRGAGESIEPSARGWESRTLGCALDTAGPWQDEVVPLSWPERSISAVSPLDIINTSSGLS